MSRPIDLTILTHHKCATNWMRGICRDLGHSGVIAYEIVGSKKQPTDVVVASDVKHVLLDVNAIYNSAREKHFKAARSIHFVRDPRDALVSTYWSWLKSHRKNNENILEFRERASAMSVEEGLLELIPDFPMGRQLETWTDQVFASVHQVRYEDLLDNFDQTLIAMFNHGDISLPQVALDKVRVATDFTRLTGRQRGDEDAAHHFRKGVAGDWQNHFTDRVAKKFYAEFGWLGPKLGYW